MFKPIWMTTEPHCKSDNCIVVTTFSDDPSSIWESRLNLHVRSSCNYSAPFDSCCQEEFVEFFSNWTIMPYTVAIIAIILMTNIIITLCIIPIVWQVCMYCAMN